MGALKEHSPKPLTVGLVQKLLQPPLLNQLLQMVPQCLTILDGMSPVLVVLAMEALVAPQRISTHLVQPFEIRLVLDLL